MHNGKGPMKRLLIFSGLFPPLALSVYIASDPLFWSSLDVGLVLWMLALAYAITIIPAWLTAGVDWVLSANPLFLRLAASVAVATILTVLTARYLGQHGETRMFGSLGAIPAAVCSWLSNIKPRKA
jgi:hypothetical protein